MAISAELRELWSSLKPMDVPAIPCSDCEPSVDGKEVTHEPMCTIAICIEDATQGDRRWFEAHPFSDHYYREMTWGEGSQLLLHDETAQNLARNHHLAAMGRVRVDHIREGVRSRRFEDVYFVITGERDEG